MERHSGAEVIWFGRSLESTKAFVLGEISGQKGQNFGIVKVTESLSMLLLGWEAEGNLCAL